MTSDTPGRDKNPYSVLAIECEVCLPKSKTAKLLVETADSHFYYCYKCKNWFQVNPYSRKFVGRVSDPEKLKSLTWLLNSDTEAPEYSPTEQAGKIFEKFKRFYLSLLDFEEKEK